MPSLSLQTPYALLLPALLVWTAACDRTNIDTDPPGTFGEELQTGSVRAGLTGEGIESLFRTSNSDGLPLEQPPVQTAFDGTPLSIGPISQTVPVRTVDVAVRNARVELSITVGSSRITIPVRAESADGTRICQFRLVSLQWTVRAEASDNSARRWKLELTAPPEFETRRLRIRPVQLSCPLLERGEVPEGLAQLLTDYLEQSVADGVRTFVDVPVYETLGLLRDRISVLHVSSFSNRRGAVEFAAESPESGGIELAPPGLRASLDAGVTPRLPTPGRQRCVPPPQQPPDPDPGAAGRVDPAEVDASNAELGLALSESLARRMVRSVALAGFLCRGLDSGVGDRDSPTTLDRRSANLAVVGLDELPVEGQLETLLKPESPPELELLPDRNQVAITWERLTVELYGRRHGTPVKVLELTSTPTFRLRLRPAEGSKSGIAYEIRSFEIGSVDRESFKSPWDATLPSEGLRSWARRLLREIFTPSLAIPLPAAPGAVLNPVDVQVRENDLLFLVRLGRP